jgi:hypothetical protein
MKSTLESCVDKMTSQTMTFNHEGIEVNRQIMKLYMGRPIYLHWEIVVS